MKKYFSLLLVLCFNLFGYEYVIYNNPYATGNSSELIYYHDQDGILKVKNVYKNGNEFDSNNPERFFNTLSYIKSGTSRYITNDEFFSIYSNDLLLLNDLYIQQLQPFLNFLYNDESFSGSNYIEYENYQLLYDANGLAVESIVNGNWAGIYSDSEKSSSGYLYNSGGTLIYYNGEKVSWIQSTIDKVLQGVIGNLHTLIRLISTPVGVCVSVVFALCLVYYVVEVGRRAIKPIDDNIRKRNFK